MDLRVNGSLELPTLQSCNLPILTKDGDTGHFEAIPIFDYEHLCPDLTRIHDSGEHLVKAAWAVLLRIYIQDDIINYALLSDGQQGASTEVPHNGKAEVFVVQYRLHNSCQLKNINVAACHHYPRQALKKTPINTAINLCICSASSGEEENPERLGSRCFLFGSLNEVSHLLLTGLGFSIFFTVIGKNTFCSSASTAY